MAKYIITYKYVYTVEVEADDEWNALEKGEEIMVMREECGDLGAPERFEEEANLVVD